MTNIAAGSGAIGVCTLDTTKLANGLHTIAWAVTDDQGRGGRNRQPVLHGAERASATVMRPDTAGAALPQIRRVAAGGESGVAVGERE